MKNELISVIVPIYKVEKYLKRCLDSLIRQTYSNLEIILVDDGSPDTCPLICDEYKAKHNNIKVIHKKNGGLSDARNVGIEASTGSYITFVDSDDYVEDDYIVCLYNSIKKYNADISICSYQAVYENGRIIKQSENLCCSLTPKETLSNMLYQNNFNVSAWAKLYKRELFNKIKFPKGKIFEDAYTTYKLVLDSRIIAVDLQIKYNYMIRSNSILTSEFNEDKLMLIDAYKEMGNTILKTYPDLFPAVMRARIYANISTLRQMIFSNKRLIKKEKNIQKFIRENYKYIMFNDLSAIRDKIATVLICININTFKLFWIVYCKFTGRLYN